MEKEGEKGVTKVLVLKVSCTDQADAMLLEVSHHALAPPHMFHLIQSQMHGLYHIHKAILPTASSYFHKSNLILFAPEPSETQFLPIIVKGC